MGCIRLPGRETDVAGFTLLELLVVTALMVAIVFMMAPIFSGLDDQERFDRTAEMLAEIRRAVLGDPGSLSTDRMRLAGYVQDMGGLPALQAVPGGPDTARQPRGLWTTDLDDDGVDDLVRRTLFIDDYWDHYFQSSGYPDTATAAVSLGWRGPYIEAPRDGALKDGWGNPIVFLPDTPDDGDLTIKSLGADGAPGGAGHDGDVAVTIKKYHYSADVAGYVAPNSFYDHTAVTVELYFAPPDPPYAPETRTVGGAMVPQPKIKNLKSQTRGVGEDGYFLFRGVPVGRERILKITEQVQLGDKVHTSLMFRRFCAMPGANWLGTIEMETIYEAPW
jgi:type II secretory pathway pseudopilin PulG